MIRTRRWVRVGAGPGLEAGGLAAGSIRGNRTVNALPRPGPALVTSMRPLWRSTRRLTSVSPMPRPALARCRLVSPWTNNSKIRGSRSAGMPAPVSSTRRTASGPSPMTATMTRPSAGVNFTALGGGAEIDRARAEDDLAGGQSSDVEEIVDESNQDGDLPHDDLPRVLVALVERTRDFDDVQRGGDDAQRIAQLVAEHGEELVLGSAGRLRLDPGALALAFHPFPLAYVEADADACVVGQPDVRPRRRDDAAVLRGHVDVMPTVGERVHVRADLCPMRWIVRGLRHQVDWPGLRRGPSGQPLELLVESQDLGIGFVHADHHGNAIVDGLQQRALAVSDPDQRGHAQGHHGHRRQERLQHQERVRWGDGKRAEPLHRPIEGDPGE